MPQSEAAYVARRALMRARAALRRRFSHGFSKCRFARMSRMMPSRSSFFFRRRRAFSTDSPFLILTSVVTKTNHLLSGVFPARAGLRSRPAPHKIGADPILPVPDCQSQTTPTSVRGRIGYAEWKRVFLLGMSCKKEGSGRRGSLLSCRWIYPLSERRIRKGNATRQYRESGKRWCSRGDSNPHGLPHMPLKHACLPIPPPEHRDSVNLVVDGAGPYALGRRLASFLWSFFAEVEKDYRKNAKKLEVSCGFGDGKLGVN